MTLLAAALALTFSVEPGLAGRGGEELIALAVLRAQTPTCGGVVLGLLAPGRDERRAPRHVLFSSGLGRRTCADPLTLAFTQQYGAQVLVCVPQISRVRPEVALVTLIHEVLHTQGLCEWPPHEGCAGSLEISRTIEQACGIDAKGAFR